MKFLKSKIQKLPKLHTVIFLITAIGRVVYSADRLPPDPGFGFFEESYSSNLLVIFRTEGGYLDVPRRLLAEVIVLFPMRYLALVGTAIWVLICVTSAMYVSHLVQKSGNSRFVGFLSGLVVVLVPSASESQIGNQSVIKWFLVLTLIFSLAAPTKTISLGVLVALVVFTGISNPVTFLVLLSFAALLIFRRETNLSIRNLSVVAAFFLGLVIEFLAWKSTGVGVHKYDDSVYLLWSGAGLFWYYNFLMPVLTLLALLGTQVKLFGLQKPSRFVVDLCVYGLSLFFGTYYLGGIADRYLVIPQCLAFVAFLIYLSENFRVLKFFYLTVSLIFVVIGIFSMAYWYQASWFLSSGPRWSLEIDHRVKECENGGVNSVVISQFMGDFELPCEVLIERS